jgi:hypothetical protein
LRNLRILRELWDKNAFQNIIFTTTMWDEVSEEEGEDRERELKSVYWQAMLQRGSTTGRFMPRTHKSALSLIDPLIDAANKRSSVLIQNELVDMRKKLPSTSAGQELLSQLEILVRQREDLVRRIRNEMMRTDGDKMILEALQEEHSELQISLEATVNEMQRLKLPLGYQFFGSNWFKPFRFTVSGLRRRTDSYVSDPESTVPESEENLPQPEPSMISRQQLPMFPDNKPLPSPPSFVIQPPADPLSKVRDFSKSISSEQCELCANGVLSFVRLDSSST